MAQIIDPIPDNHLNRLLCCYTNATSQIQVARITNLANWYFERVVFPGQRLVFEALPEAMLEIHCGMMASAIISDTIPCERLKIDDASLENGQLSSSPSSVATAPLPMPAAPSLAEHPVVERLNAHLTPMVSAS